MVLNIQKNKTENIFIQFYSLIQLRSLLGDLELYVIASFVLESNSPSFASSHLIAHLLPSVIFCFYIDIK